MIGKLIWKGNKLCFEHASNHYTRPTRSIQVWDLEMWPTPMDDEDRDFRLQLEGLETESYHSPSGGHEVRIPCNGRSRTVLIPGNKKALEVREELVPQPKTKKETRYHLGRWEKLLKKGWVLA